MRHAIILLSDTHYNSATGPYPADNSIPLEAGEHKASRVQAWLYECFLDYVEWCKAQLQPDDKVWIIHHGDVVDSPWKHSVPVVSVNEADILTIGEYCLRPLLAIRPDATYVQLRGTEAHSGAGQSLEEALAVRLGAELNPDTKLHSWYVYDRDFGGFTLNATHHARLGGQPWNLLNPLGNTAYKLVDRARRLTLPIPQVATRGHVHRPADTGQNYPIRIITLPGWQANTLYGHRIDPDNPITEFGGGLILTENGQYEYHLRRYQAKGRLHY